MNDNQAPFEVDPNDVIASLRNQLGQAAVEVAMRDATISRLRADFDRMAEGMSDATPAPREQPSASEN